MSESRSNLLRDKITLKVLLIKGIVKLILHTFYYVNEVLFIGLFAGSLIEAPIIFVSYFLVRLVTQNTLGLDDQFH